MIDKIEGKVKESLPGLTFRVDVDGGKDGGKREVLGHLAGKLRLHRIKVLPGDRVLIEMGPDGRRGRIVRRL